MTATTRGRAPRRTALVGLSALTLATLVACGTEPTSTGKETENPGVSVPEGPFTYDDARGKTIELDSVPTKVVAESSIAAGLWDAGYRVDGVFGELGKVDGELNYQAGNLDLSELEVLGETFGEFDMEGLGLMDPDLVVDYSMDGKSLWYVPAAQVPQVEERSTTLAVSGTEARTVQGAIDAILELGEKLGLDTESEEIAEAEADYQAAVEEVEALAKEKQDLDILVVSMTPDQFYFSDPRMFPDLITLKEMGLNFVQPEGKPVFFHAASWEQAGKYDADVILYDARTLGGIEKADSVPTWTRLPAVKAGQVHKWYPAPPSSYQAYTEIFTEIASWLKDAEKVS